MPSSSGRTRSTVLSEPCLPSSPGLLRIELVYASAPRRVHETSLEVHEGCTLNEALELAGWLEQYPELASGDVSLGVWGRRSTGQTRVREGDRVEIYRGLRVDPKVARRERFNGQGARTAGLFARRRPNSKAGY